MDDNKNNNTQIQVYNKQIHNKWSQSLDKIYNSEKKEEKEKEKKEMTKENYQRVIYNKFQLNKLDSAFFCGRTKSQVHNLHIKKKNFVFLRKTIKLKIYKSIPISLNSISDLISIAENNSVEFNHEYNIPLKKIHEISPYLKNLNNFVGIKELKNQILDQILYFLQDFQGVDSDSEYLHTILAGPPGTGKTEIAQLIGNIYSHLGILKKGTFKKVTRSDLIGGYLGQTAMKTKDVINASLGGVLFIDEAYALGNAEKRDSFSKECIDTLCEALSSHKSELMVIIAGYEEELQNCFFSYNQGLASRFIWKFKIDKYSSEELSLIMKKKIKDCEWTTENDKILNAIWFEAARKWFPNFGRDIENLLTKIKICHSRRIFGNDIGVKKSITAIDVKKGFEVYCRNDNLRKDIEKNELSTSLCSIYV